MNHDSDWKHGAAGVGAARYERPLKAPFIPNSQSGSLAPMHSGNQRNTGFESSELTLQGAPKLTALLHDLAATDPAALAPLSARRAESSTALTSPPPPKPSPASVSSAATKTVMNPGNTTSASARGFDLNRSRLGAGFGYHGTQQKPALNFAAAAPPLSSQTVLAKQSTSAPGENTATTGSVKRLGTGREGGHIGVTSSKQIGLVNYDELPVSLIDTTPIHPDTSVEERMCQEYGLFEGNLAKSIQSDLSKALSALRGTHLANSASGTGSAVGLLSQKPLSSMLSQATESPNTGSTSNIQRLLTGGGSNPSLAAKSTQTEGTSGLRRLARGGEAVLFGGDAHKTHLSATQFQAYENDSGLECGGGGEGLDDNEIPTSKPIRDRASIDAGTAAAIAAGLNPVDAPAKSRISRQPTGSSSTSLQSTQKTSAGRPRVPPATFSSLRPTSASRLSVKQNNEGVKASDSHVSHSDKADAAVQARPDSATGEQGSKECMMHWDMSSNAAPSFDYSKASELSSTSQNQTDSFITTLASQLTLATRLNSKQAQLLKEQGEKIKSQEALLRKYRRQAKEFFKFLADYGLSWAGYQVKGDEAADEEDSENESEGATDNANTDKDHDDSKPLYLYFDKDEFLARLRELNSRTGEGKMRIGKRKDGSQGFIPTPTMSITVYYDGLWLRGGPLRPFSMRECQAFVQDILDGYCPIELKDEFPDGVVFSPIQDCAHLMSDGKPAPTASSETESTKEPQSNYKPFSGVGHRFTAEDWESTQPIPSQVSSGAQKVVSTERPNSASQQSQPKVRSLNSESVAPHERPRLSVSEFLDTLPSTVVSDGRLIQIKSSVAETLKATTSGSTTSDSTSKQTVDPVVLARRQAAAALLKERLQSQKHASSASRSNSNSPTLTSAQPDASPLPPPVTQATSLERGISQSRPNASSNDPPSLVKQSSDGNYLTRIRVTVVVEKSTDPELKARAPKEFILRLQHDQDSVYHLRQAVSKELASALPAGSLNQPYVFELETKVAHRALLEDHAKLKDLGSLVPSGNVIAKLTNVNV